MRRLLLASILSLSLLPGVHAHAAPDPLDNETHMLADGGDDTYAYTGGLDLQDLFAREAWYRSRDAEGVIFRMIIYGSVSPGGAGGPLRLSLDWNSPGGTRSLALSSTDGTTYTAEGADLVEASMEAEGTAVQGSVQVFVDYATLGAERGQSIDGLTWRSWVGEDLRDLAPGGRPVPGSRGALMVDEESTVVTQSLALAGPQGYTRSTTSFEDGSLVVEVQNLITTTGQHIIIELPDDTLGWTLGEPEPAGAAVDAGQHPTFRMTATPTKDAGALAVYVTSDLGGREALVLQAPGATGGGEGSAPANTASDEPGKGKDAPAPPLVLALAALGAAVLIARRATRNR